MNIRHLKTSFMAWSIVLFNYLLVFAFIIFTISSPVSAAPKMQGISESQLETFAQNNILFYDPGECIGGSSSANYNGICGSTAIEKYWSAISQYIDDPVDIAGIMGNIVGEGNFNPVSWEGGPTYEGGGINPSGELLLGWDYYYNNNSTTTGLGAVQTTSELSHYLHYINDKYPELLKYHKDTKEYSYNWRFHPNSTSRQGEESYGDDLLEKIGEAEFDKLVAMNVRYFLKDWPLAYRVDNYLAKNASTPSEAAAYWAIDYEICRECQPGSSAVDQRAKNAEFLYDLLKDFKCSSSTTSTSSTTSSSTISGNDITWIGDSYSVGALNEIKSKFPGVDLGTENPGNTSSPYSNIQVGKHLDASADEGSGGKSGTAILKEIKDSGKLRPYLVLALGTNDQNTTEETAKSILDYVANEVGDTKVILTTALTNVPDNKDNSYYSELNNTIKSFANSHSNFEFADWESAAKDKKEEYYKNDNLHPTNGDGYDVWLGTISDALDKTPTSNSNSSNTNVGVCGNTTTVNVSIGDKGLTVEQAQKIADYYNSNAVTAKNFIGNDIPSSYQKVNCVSFSLWFVSAFTDASDNGATWDQLVNDGAYIASTGLPSIGWTTGNNPTPFSVFGGTGSAAWSHTGVVVGADEDGKIITIEAAYAEHDAQVGTRDPSYFASGVGILAYPGEHFTPSKGHLGNKSFNEILGN